MRTLFTTYSNRTLSNKHQNDMDYYNSYNYFLLIFHLDDANNWMGSLWTTPSNLYYLFIQRLGHTNKRIMIIFNHVIDIIVPFTAFVSHQCPVNANGLGLPFSFGFFIFKSNLTILFTLYDYIFWMVSMTVSSHSLVH